MKKKYFLSFFLLYLPLLTIAQTRKGDVYPSIPVDPTYGIVIYEKLNVALGGDSIRNDKRGYACIGWYEDFYASGQLLHRGYYDEGQLKVYKNYYDNGQLEREFKASNFNASSLRVYYRNGSLKSQVEYRNTQAKKWQDFYADGQLEFIEEYDNDGIYVQRKYFKENGMPESILELTNEKKKMYSSKEYYANGKIKTEGEIVYKKSLGDYQKEGKWLTYDENGKLTSEQNFAKGLLANEKKF